MLRGNRLAAVIMGALLAIVVIIIAGAVAGVSEATIGAGIAGAVSLGSVAAVVVREEEDVIDLETFNIPATDDQLLEAYNEAGDRVPVPVTIVAKNADPRTDADRSY